MKNKLKKVLAGALTTVLAFTCFTCPAYAEEGAAESFWGNFEIPAGDGTKHFAFADSRYYNGTDEVNVFNIGIDLGNAGEFYTNGDWTDMTKVYRREEYYSSEEFIDFSENGQVGEPKPEGYPENDVGADAKGTLASYNAGTYTKVALSGFDTFGRQSKNNYEGVVPDGFQMTTYIEIWKVEPELALSTDKDKVDRGDTFTLTLTVENHFDNMDGLPAVEDVFFQADHAAAVSAITKTDNMYTQEFRAAEDMNIGSVHIEAGILETAANYKAGNKALTLLFPAQEASGTEEPGKTDGGEGGLPPENADTGNKEKVNVKTGVETNAPVQSPLPIALLAGGIALALKAGRKKAE